MKNNLLTFVFLSLALVAFGQDTQSYDPRLLLHFSEEQLSQMPPAKYAGVYNYYCNSYTIDASGVDDFNIQEFDISLYEEFRKQDSDFTIVTDQGVRVTLKSAQTVFPKAQLMKS